MDRGDHSGPSNSSVKEVPCYQSNDSTTKLSHIIDEQKKLKNWRVLKEFINAEEAHNFIKSENIWSQSYTRAVEDGIKTYYRCNKANRRATQCIAELYLLYVNDEDKVLAYISDIKHNHDTGNKTRQRNKYGTSIDRETKTKPTVEMSEMHLMELERWIHRHTAVPEDDNEVFVISYQVLEGNQPEFQFALSTKRLLKIICFTDIIHADATNRIKEVGYPVAIVGTSDENRDFFPLCLGITTHERQEDFRVIFQGLKDKVMLIYDHIMKPRVLVCDAADAIQNAFIVVFGAQPIIRVCWTHAKINIQQKIQQLVTTRDQKSISRDVCALHNAASPELFSRASQAFLDKWKKEAIFLKYFEDEWLNKNPNWFLGAAFKSPSTNNALESLSLNIKTQCVLSEKFTLKFLAVASNLVCEWSSRQVASLPATKTIHLEDWMEAYVWEKIDIKVNIISSDDTNRVFLTCNGNENAHLHNTRLWTTFDEYKHKAAAFVRTKLPNSDWENGSCECPQYFKKYICKHILGLAIRLKLTKPPPEIFNNPIKEKRKRPRPV